MQLFYNPDISTNSRSFSFNKEESRHIVRVLRKTEGDQLTITNGNGMVFFATIIQAMDKKCVVEIDKWENKPKSWDYHLHIAIAPTKMNDRFEWFLEKATEIGIDEITPIYCHHSERKNLKTDRMQKVIVSAMKQSLKFSLPKLNPPIKFNQFINDNSAELRLIAHCQDADKPSLKNLIKGPKNIVVLIGPEGDFSSEEIATALSHNFQPISLGDSRLRTETAGIIACSNISLLKEIM